VATALDAKQSYVIPTEVENGVSGTSDIDGTAAWEAVSMPGDMRIKSLPAAAGRNASRKQVRSLDYARDDNLWGHAVIWQRHYAKQIPRANSCLRDQPNRRRSFLH
jgi:hypothetical protein